MADPRFSEGGGANPRGRCPNLLFGSIFTENSMKILKNWQYMYICRKLYGNERILTGTRWGGGRVANPRRRFPNLLFGSIFAENCVEMKKLDRDGGGGGGALCVPSTNGSSTDHDMCIFVTELENKI